MEKKAYTVKEKIIICALSGLFVVLVALVFSNSKIDFPKRIQKTEAMLNQAVTYSEGENNLSSTQWDYSLSPNEFFKKYISDYLNYSYLLERNLENNDESTEYYAYFVNSSYLKLQKSECMDFLYDANGDKAPNMMGQDQYMFYLCPQKYIDKNNFIHIQD